MNDEILQLMNLSITHAQPITYKVFSFSGNCNPYQCVIIDINYLILIFCGGIIFTIWLIRQIEYWKKYF